MSSMPLFWLIVVLVVVVALGGGWLLAGRPTSATRAGAPRDFDPARADAQRTSGHNTDPPRDL